MGFLRNLATFKRGVHPDDNKDLTRHCHIEPGPVPKHIAVMLSQHIGAACVPIVGKNDVVHAGQKIGDTDACVAAPVHSPVNGTVKDIALQTHAVLGRTSAVLIDAGQDNPVKQPSPESFEAGFDEEKYAPDEIINLIREAGVVGMGGAGFPTAVKFKANPAMPIDTIVVNACECEPYITCDYRVVLEWPLQVIVGAKLARRAAGAQQIIIAIEDNKPEAIKIINEALGSLRDSANISIAPLKTKYPQGGERQLIQAVLNRTVPTGGIPPMVGVAVSNVATCAAIAEAVVLRHPLTYRVVTVSGKGIARPGNFYVPVGLPVGELIEFCGGLDNAVKVVLGGPMMGIATADLSTPVTKTTSAITVLTAQEIGKGKSTPRESPCIRCGRCVTACPLQLTPTKIAHAAKHNMMDMAKEYHMSACVECGSCSFVCPANIQLAAHIKTGKLNEAKKKKNV